MQAERRLQVVRQPQVERRLQGVRQPRAERRLQGVRQRQVVRRLQVEPGPQAESVVIRTRRGSGHSAC
jgi:hypothetical protein